MCYIYKVASHHLCKHKLLLHILRLNTQLKLVTVVLANTILSLCVSVQNLQQLILCMFGSCKLSDLFQDDILKHARCKCCCSKLFAIIKLNPF